MSTTVSKSELVNIICEAFLPVLNRRFENGTITDDSHKDTRFVKLCDQLITDIGWLFKYTIDGETYSHSDELIDGNKFQTWGLHEYVATEDVSSFLYKRSENYFHQDQIIDNKLDWFYLDFIIAVGFQVLKKKYKAKDFALAYPHISKAIDEYDGVNIIELIKYIVFAILKNGIVFGLVMFLIFLPGEENDWAAFLGIGLLILKVYSWYAQFKLYEKLQHKSVERLDQYKNLYKLFAGGSVRWDMLEYDIKRLRDLSIEFPLVIDTAITARKRLN